MLPIFYFERDAFAQITISFHAASMNKNDFIFGKRLLFVYFCTN